MVVAVIRMAAALQGIAAEPASSSAKSIFPRPFTSLVWRERPFFERQREQS